MNEIMKIMMQYPAKENKNLVQGVSGAFLNLSGNVRKDWMRFIDTKNVFCR